MVPENASNETVDIRRFQPELFSALEPEALKTKIESLNRVDEILLRAQKAFAFEKRKGDARFSLTAGVGNLSGSLKEGWRQGKEKARKTQRGIYQPPLQESKNETPHEIFQEHFQRSQNLTLKQLLEETPAQTAEWGKISNETGWSFEGTVSEIQQGIATNRAQLISLLNEHETYAVRIAGGSGFLGDYEDALFEIITGGPVDYVTMDFLAELTFSILNGQKAKAAAKIATEAKSGEVKTKAAGYARAFIDIIKPVIHLILDKGIKIVTNAAGINGEACILALQEVLRERSEECVIAALQGDDLMEKLPEILASGSLFDMNGNVLELDPKKISAANAYVGIEGIVEALEKGAQIVVGGRIADPSLTAGPAQFEFGWKDDDWDKRAAAAIAGHINECGCQATGGNFSRWKEVPNPKKIGYPIIEMMADGTFIVTKHPGTGGLVTIDTVREQILYEMQNPRSFITPDVVIDLSEMRLEQVGADRVKVSGIKGKPPTDKYKVSIIQSKDESRAIGEMNIPGGKDAKEMAELYTDILLSHVQGKTHRVRTISAIGETLPGAAPDVIDEIINAFFEDYVPPAIAFRTDTWSEVESHPLWEMLGARTQKALREIWQECHFANNEIQVFHIGQDACAGADLAPDSIPGEVTLRIGVRSKNTELLQRFSRMLNQFILNVGKGITYRGGRPEIEEMKKTYLSALVPKELVEQTLQLSNDSAVYSIHPNPNISSFSEEDSTGQIAREINNSPQEALANPELYARGDCEFITLSEILLARSGDKGNHGNIGIAAHGPKGFQFLRDFLTAQRMLNLWGRRTTGVTRYEVPGIHSFNFILENILQGGATENMGPDTQGKSLGNTILQQKMLVPVEVIAEAYGVTVEEYRSWKRNSQMHRNIIGLTRKVSTAIHSFLN